MCSPLLVAPVPLSWSHQRYGPLKENKSLTRHPFGRFFLALAVFFAPGLGWAGGGPVFSAAGPDAAAYGEAEAYPAGSRAVPVPQASMVGHYTHFQEKFPHRIAPRAVSPSALGWADNELKLTYSFGGVTHDLSDYLSRHPVTGLLIAQDGMILYEHYQYDRNAQDAFLSQSMAKTITSLLVGIALHEGAIRSVDQPAADYVPGLAGSEYGKTPIRALLHMASGVAFKEVYDGPGDNQTLNRMLFVPGGPVTAKAVTVFNTREAPPDTRFHYAGVETEVLGLVLARAVKMPLTEYLRTRIWQPMGAEADAAWTVDHTGQEIAYCCVSAVLHDWARLGLMLAHDGAWNGKQIVPREFVLSATTPEAAFQRPGTATRFFGYGDQIWLFPGPRRQFALLGIHGQAIFVDPLSKLVLVHTAVRLKPSNDPAALELRALWAALVAR